MKAFKDQSGKVWTLQINVSSVKRCRAHAEVDLPGLFDDECKGLQALTSDPIKFIELIYVLIQEEAKERNISQDDFESSMSGDAIECCMDAFLAELIEFFPEPRKRDALKKILKASRDLQDKIMDQAENRINSINIEEIAKNLNNSVGPQREYSDLIRDRLQPGNST